MATVKKLPDEIVHHILSFLGSSLSNSYETPSSGAYGNVLSKASKQLRNIAADIPELWQHITLYLPKERNRDDYVARLTAFTGVYALGGARIRSLKIIVTSASDRHFLGVLDRYIEHDCMMEYYFKSLYYLSTIVPPPTKHLVATSSGYSPHNVSLEATGAGLETLRLLDCNVINVPAQLSSLKSIEYDNVVHKDNIELWDLLRSSSSSLERLIISMPIQNGVCAGYNVYPGSLKLPCLKLLTLNGNAQMLLKYLKIGECSKLQYLELSGVPEGTQVGSPFTIPQRITAPQSMTVLIFRNTGKVFFDVSYMKLNRLQKLVIADSSLVADTLGCNNRMLVDRKLSLSYFELGADIASSTKWEFYRDLWSSMMNNTDLRGLRVRLHQRSLLPIADVIKLGQQAKIEWVGY